MSEYYHIVPWYNSEEWHQVYNKIYSTVSTSLTKQEALNLLLIWKARCPSLPSGIESTFTLLEVHIQDIKNCDDMVNEQLLRLAYSSALMRFVNHMLDTETAKGTSLYQAAKNLGVPDWIIDMRHDTAHSNNLPSIELLREATLISLDWLQKNYWDKHKLCLNDYTSGQKETDNNEEHKIAALMNFCISLSVCAHSKCKIKNLSDIPDANMRESIVNDARDLFGGHIDLSNLKTISVTALINIMNKQAKKLLNSNDTTTHVNKALLSDDSLFLSLELLNFVGDGDFCNKKQLSGHYMQCFEVLLTFLHTNDLLLDFILQLIEVSQCSEDSNRCLLAALWVSEILKALTKCKQFYVKMKKINNDELSNKKRKELKSLFHHWFPNEKVSGLLLDLQKPIPRELSSLDYIQAIISAYNPYLTYFIKDLLNLVEPQLPKDIADKIYKLAKLISAPESIPMTSSNIYTVEDLKMAEDLSSESIELIEENQSNCSNSFCEVEIRSNNKTDDLLINSIWRLASSEYNWTTCAIGQLPWQIPKDTIAEMET